MMMAYRPEGGRMVTVADPHAAVWIDLEHPGPDEIALVRGFGIEVPSLADMEEIEISNRLYHEGPAHYMTVVMAGLDQAGTRRIQPVTFILTDSLLVTVRHHCPRPFVTYPPRAGQSAAGTEGAAAILLGLMDEIVGRQADHLEEVGRSLDQVSELIHAPDPDRRTPERLQFTLQKVGREGELLSHLRLTLLTLTRALAYFQPIAAERGHAATTKAVLRDIQALEVHGDFLAQRVALASSTTLGMIDLAQGATTRIVSVVSVLFLPPTLIASIYGMNFARMPELAQTWGYPVALLAMLASALLSWAYFKWRGWL